MVGSTEVMRGNNFDKPLTLGELVGKLVPGESIMADLPNGKTRHICNHSRLDRIDAALLVAKPYKYDWLSKTYHVKTGFVSEKYKPGLCDSQEEDYHDNKIEIKPRNRCYIDPIAHTKELNEFDPISRTKNIREWYGLLYDKYFKIKRIICDGPATIIFWNDGTKTVVKAQEDFDYEKGILYAALKKLATKKEYDNILRAIDKVDETRKDDPIKSIRDNLFPDHTLSPDEAEEFMKEVEKPKKKVYKRHFGDSNQRCPYCGQNWIWSGKRRNSFYHDGFIKFTCKNCGRKIIYTKEGKYA